MEKKYLLLGLMAILLANPASSQDCPSVEPTCDEMGYVNTAEECDGKQTVRCPFDTTKLFCGDGGGNCPEGKIEAEGYCHRNYTSCEDAGYHTASDGCGSVKIYVNGEQQTCYYHCCPDGYYKIDGECRKTYANCSAAGYSDDDTGCGAVIIYVDSGASFQKKICYNSKCCKSTEVDDGGVCTTYYSSCSNAGAAQRPKKSLQSSSNDCPVTPQFWIGTSSTDAKKTTCYDTDCCATGTCRVNGTCYTLYSDCDAFQSGWSTTRTGCDSATVYVGSSCDTVTKTTCYEQGCTPTCASNQCLYHNGCVTCYSSCESAGYLSEKPKNNSCSTITVLLRLSDGTGYYETCYRNCSSSCSTGKCLNENNDCVTCYSSCSDWKYGGTTDELTTGRVTKEDVCIRNGSSSETCSTTTCYWADCTGAGECVTSTDSCVDCVSDCPAGTSETEPSSGVISSTTYWIGSGYGSKTTTQKTCYSSTCGGANECMKDGSCVSCYSSCSDAGNGWGDEQPQGYTCVAHPDINIGAGGGSAVTETVTCYSGCSQDCTACIDPRTGSCAACSTSCATWSEHPGATETAGSSGIDHSQEVLIGAGNGATGTWKTCHWATCTGATECVKDGNCLSNCVSGCDAGETEVVDTSKGIVRGPLNKGSNGSTAQIIYCATCLESNKCVVNGQCVECYTKCEDKEGYYAEEPDEMVCATTQAPLYIGEGFGASAQQQNCLTNCKRNCAKQGLSTAPDGSCVTSYPDCQTAYSNDPRLTSPCPTVESSGIGYEWADHIESLKCLLAEENSSLSYSKTDLANEGFSCSALTKVWIDVWDDDPATEAGDDTPADDQYTEYYATEQMCYKCTCACPNEVMEEDADGNVNTKIVCAKYSSCSDWNANAVDTKPTNYTWTKHTVDGLCSGDTCYLKGEYCSGGRSVSSDGKSCVCPSSTPLWDNTNSKCKKACPKDVSYCSAYDSSYDDCNCSACQSGYILQLNASTGKLVCESAEVACDVSKIPHCTGWSDPLEPCYCMSCESGYSLNSNHECVAATCSSKYQDFVNGVCTNVYSSCYAAGYISESEKDQMIEDLSSDPEINGAFCSTCTYAPKATPVSLYIGTSNHYELTTCYSVELPARVHVNEVQDCDHDAPSFQVGSGAQNCIYALTGLKFSGSGIEGFNCSDENYPCYVMLNECSDLGYKSSKSSSDISVDFARWDGVGDVTVHVKTCYITPKTCSSSYDRRTCMSSCFAEYSEKYRSYRNQYLAEGVNYEFVADTCKLICPECS